MKYKNDMKKSWSVIKSMINRNRSIKVQKKFKLSNGLVVTDGCTITENFNNFFTNVGPNLARSIPNQSTSPEEYLGQSINYSIFLEPVTEDEIRKIVTSLKDSAPGHDELPAAILKSALSHINEPLVHICNLSILQGVFSRGAKES